MTKRIIYWFRNDLRLHDNEAFFKACQEGDEVLPVYVFDSQQFTDTALGFKKTGYWRTRFIRESLEDLRAQLRARGGDLLIRHGEPDRIIAQLAEQYKAEYVYTSKLIAQEETEVESALSKRLKTLNIDFKMIWGDTLYHVRDLPFLIHHLPDIFTEFRKSVERRATIRKTFGLPKTITLPTPYEAGALPSYEALGFDENTLPKSTPLAVMEFKGGETAGLQRLHHYLWDTKALRQYKETRNGLLGADYSSKFSPWLSLGCLSPRTVYEEVKRFEGEFGANDSTYWLIFELLWRDYFHFVTLRFGTRLFKDSGIKHDLETKWVQNKAIFEKWCSGQTGIPFIDANMHELNATGFMSNRGRQNVASFLAKDLRLKWTWGAAYFESQLIDYDVCSNWGNWNYVAGVGNDPREDRYFNIYTQATRYDAQGDYVKHWIPALEGVPADKIHKIWTLSVEEQKRHGAILGAHYPKPIIQPNKWLKSSHSR